MVVKRAEGVTDDHASSLLQFTLPTMQLLYHPKLLSKLPVSPTGKSDGVTRLCIKDDVVAVRVCQGVNSRDVMREATAKMAGLASGPSPRSLATADVLDSSGPSALDGRKRRVEEERVGEDCHRQGIL